MGACCSSPAGADKDRTPVYYYCPQTLEEREPILFTNVPSSAISPALFVDTNLDLSVPDSYQAPPAPVPYDADLAGSHTVPRNIGNCGTKVCPMQLTGSGSAAEAVTHDRNLNSSECKNEVFSEKDTLEAAADEPSKLREPDVLVIEEEDVCPTCLEEYTLENPRILTKCEHHFHLSCILEWMERSATCPICDQIMIFDVGSEE